MAIATLSAEEISKYLIQASVTLRRGNLYKYKSLKGQHFNYVTEIIRDRVIYCPRPSEMNDPEECKPQLTIGEFANPSYRPRVEAWVRRCISHRVHPPSEAEIQTELRQLNQARLESLAQETTDSYRQAVDKRYRILSLADSAYNEHLWASYADSYEGVCLEFFVDPMLGSSYQVQYADAIPVLDITNNEGLDALVATVLFKRPKWKSEGEYRLVLGDPPVPGDPPLINQKLRFPPALLTSILFGYRVAADHRKRLIDLVRQEVPRMRIFEARGGPAFQKFTISTIPN